MTQSKDLVYLSPDDTLEEARALLAHSGVRHLPILSGSTLLGVISPRDIARCLHLAVPTHDSAKKAFVSTVMPHKGIPMGTRLVDKVEQAEQVFALRSAVCNLPHPKKGTLGEDAFLLGPTIVGVADGVGSWWEHDVDPAVYARAMMHVAKQACVNVGREAEATALRPQRVLLEAWHRMQAAKVIGSSTVCLVGLHPYKSELLAANVGDSGFLILRPPQERGVTQGPMGSLDAALASGSDSDEYLVAFRSPQQLRGFNAPYQLGRAPDSPEMEADPRFETPHDASLVRVPIRNGDLVVLGTDGLYDNMPESEVLAVVAAHAYGTEAEVATALADRALHLSLSKDVDSPFAILAKDNDIMWGGGRPDDITVVVSRVVLALEEPQSCIDVFTGPGEPPRAVTGFKDIPLGTKGKRFGVRDVMDLSWD